MDWMGSFDKILRSALGQSSEKIGTLGDIEFRVSAYDDIFTITNLKSTVGARTATHALMNKTPLIEFLGPESENITFDIQLRAWFGVNPLEAYKKLKEYCTSGEVVSFVVGGEPMGSNKWLITSVGNAVNNFDSKGKIIASDCSVTLIEYPENPAALTSTSARQSSTAGQSSTGGKT